MKNCCVDSITNPSTYLHATCDPRPVNQRVTDPEEIGLLCGTLIMLGRAHNT